MHNNSLEKRLSRLTLSINASLMMLVILWRRRVQAFSRSKRSQSSFASSVSTIGERITITCKVSRPRFQANKFLKTGSARSACSGRLTILKFDYDRPSVHGGSLLSYKSIIYFSHPEDKGITFSYLVIFNVEWICNWFIFLSKYLIAEIVRLLSKLPFLIFCDRCTRYYRNKILYVFFFFFNS